MAGQRSRKATMSLKIIGNETLTGELQTFQNEDGRDDSSILSLNILGDAFEEIKNIIRKDVKGDLTTFAEVKIFATGQRNIVRVVRLTRNQEQEVEQDQYSRSNSSLGTYNRNRRSGPRRPRMVETTIEITKTCENELTQTVREVVERVINNVWEFGKKLANDQNASRNHEWNLRNGKNSVIRYLEEFITLYVGMRVKTMFKVCMHLLQHGTFTYQIITAVLFNHMDETTTYQMLSAMNAKVSIGSMRRRDGNGQEIVTGQIAIASLTVKVPFSIELYRGFKLIFFKNDRNGQAPREGRVLRDEVDFSDLESVRGVKSDDNIGSDNRSLGRFSTSGGSGLGTPKIDVKSKSFKEAKAMLGESAETLKERYMKYQKNGKAEDVSVVNEVIESAGNILSWDVLKLTGEKKHFERIGKARELLTGLGDLVINDLDDNLIANVKDEIFGDSFREKVLRELMIGSNDVRVENKALLGILVLDVFFEKNGLTTVSDALMDDDFKKRWKMLMQSFNNMLDGGSEIAG